ncbi:MAG: hypothetical protein GY935_15900 [Gammaproteobacteria bacterium]|nr:hypothetical protein [Gammaproteobacteria bacterium]
MSACTDVTGFGLAGHLYEMLRASTCAAELYIDRIPLYAGTVSLSRAGIQNSLQPQNLCLRHIIEDNGSFASHEAYALLFDPQTAGGLLASVTAENAEPCLQQLHAMGYQHARIIGRATTLNDSKQAISLVNS